MEEQKQIFREVIARLERIHIPYMVTGGFAVSFWGRPRATFDLDLVSEITADDIPKLMKAFEGDFYVDEEMIKEALRGSKFFNIINQQTQIKTDFHIRRGDPYSRLRFQRRQRVEMLGQETNIISPEDLILIKLLWYKNTRSTRHLEDAQSVVAIQGENLDRTYLVEWAEKEGIKDLLDSLW